MTTLDTIKKCYVVVSKQCGVSVAPVLIIILVNAVIDTLGVVSILPFLAIAAKPEIIFESNILNFIYEYLEISSSKNFIILIGFVIFGFIIFSQLFKSFAIYKITSFSLLVEKILSRKLLARYLSMPYLWHMKNPGSDLIRKTLGEVSVLVESGLLQMLHAAVQLCMVVLLVILLFLIDPVVSSYAGALVFVCYVLIFNYFAPMGSRFGKLRTEAGKSRYRYLSEGISLIREVILFDARDGYKEKFSSSSNVYVHYNVLANLLASLPRFLIEAVAFGGLLALILFYMATTEDFGETISTAAVFAFAGYRLMPSLQSLYGSLIQLRVAGAAINLIYDDLVDEPLTAPNNSSISDFLNADVIKLDNISFCYPGSSNLALKRISASVKKGSFVGFVGLSGSGKSTLVDVLVGLMPASSGVLSVDGVVVNDQTVRAWMKQVGYVSQGFKLCSGSIYQNVAFGLDPDEIDQDRVKRCCEIACIHDFIEDQLPNGYDTELGDSGLNMSGGQKQRINIARAIYHSPSVIVLDEGTSALDVVTEQRVMQNLRKMDDNVTLISVTHRLSTVVNCDHIFVMKDGSIDSEGSYDDLCLNSKEFQRFLTKK